MRFRVLTALPICLALGACSSVPVSPVQTAAIAPEKKAEPTRGTPIVSGRPARLYVMAGFKEEDCSAVVPDIKITTPPAKGQVSLRPNQSTNVQHSTSGKCLGKQVAGTGIYYTGNKGQIGADSFTVTATPPGGTPTARTFQVRIVE